MSNRNDNANSRYNEEVKTPGASERSREPQNNTRRSDSRNPPVKDNFHPEATQKMMNMLKKNEDNEFGNFIVLIPRGLLTKPRSNQKEQTEFANCF